jgi:hypothetical protein
MLRGMERNRREEARDKVGHERGYEYCRSSAITTVKGRKSPLAWPSTLVDEVQGKDATPGVNICIDTIRIYVGMERRGPSSPHSPAMRSLSLLVATVPRFQRSRYRLMLSTRSGRSETRPCSKSISRGSRRAVTVPCGSCYNGTTLPRLGIVKATQT